MPTKPSLSQRIRNNRLIHTQHHLSKTFDDFDAHQTSHEHLKKIRDFLRQGVAGIHDKIVSRKKKQATNNLEATEFLTTAEQQILDILLSSFTLKHATDHIASIQAAGGKMQSLRQREAHGEVIHNRRTPSTKIGHYSLFFAMGIGHHKTPATLANAKHLVTVDLARMEREDPLSLARVWVSGHQTEYNILSVYRAKLGNAKLVISHSPGNIKTYDITYDKGTHLQWKRQLKDEVFAGADIAPGVALQLIYLLRLLGGTQNPCVKKLYDCAHERQACFELLEIIMPCVLPGCVYPEAKIIGELDINASYVSIDKNPCHAIISEQDATKHLALTSSMNADNLTLLEMLLKKGYLTNIPEHHNQLLLKALETRRPKAAIQLLIEHGLSAHDGQDAIHYAAENLTATDLDYVLSLEYASIKEPLIKYLANPKYRRNSTYFDLITYFCEHDFSGDKLRVLKKHGAIFCYPDFERALKTIDGKTNHAALAVFAKTGLKLRHDNNLEKPTKKDKVVAMLTGTGRDGKPYIVLGRPRSKREHYWFPGGSADSQDSTLLSAAARELFEETSIDVTEIPSLTTRIIQHFDILDVESHKATHIYQFDIGSTYIKPYACDDLIEARCVPLDKLVLDYSKPTSQYMTLDNIPILGSNALLIEALLLDRQEQLNGDQIKSINYTLQVEANGIQQFRKIYRSHKNNTVDWENLQRLLASMGTSQFAGFHDTNDKLADMGIGHPKLLKLILQYWPKHALIKDVNKLFKLTHCLTDFMSIYKLSYILAIHAYILNTHATSPPLLTTDSYHEEFRKRFPEALDPFSNDDRKKALLMALASARFKIDIRTANFSKFKKNWSDVKIIISHLKNNLDMNHFLDKHHKVTMDAFCLSTDADGAPTIRFITNDLVQLDRLINRIKFNCTVHQQGESYYIQCGKRRLLNLGLDVSFVNYLLTYCKNSPFLMTIPTATQKLIAKLDKNAVEQLTERVISSSENRPFVPYLTQVIKESTAIKLIKLNQSMDSSQIQQLCYLTAHHPNVTTIMIGDGINTNGMELPLSQWIGSFPKLDRLVFATLPYEHLLAWIDALSKTTHHVLFTVESFDASYCPEEYQRIEDALSQYPFQHELIIHLASVEAQQRINKTLLGNQNTWILAKDPSFANTTVIDREDNDTTEKRVRNKLYYHQYYQQCATQTEIIITDPSPELITILRSSTTLKSVTFTDGFPANELPSMLLALSESDASIDYLSLNNVKVNETTIQPLINLLRRHPVKQLKLQKVLEDNSLAINDFAKAIASHPHLETLIISWCKLCTSLFFEEILTSVNLLCVTFSPDLAPDMAKQIDAMCLANCSKALQRIRNGLTTKNLVGLSFFESDDADISAMKMVNSVFGLNCHNRQKVG